MAGLRALKAQGLYVQAATPRGTWVIHGPGELVRCPGPQCQKAFMRALETTTVCVRVAGYLGRVPDRAGSGIGFLFDCPSCKSRVEGECSLALPVGSL